MAAPVKLTRQEALALIDALVARVGYTQILSALVSVIGIERATELDENRVGRISKAETVALIKAIIPLIPGDTLKEKIKVAIADLRKAIPDRERQDDILEFVLQKIKDYKNPPMSVQAVNDGFLRLYGRVNMWCAGGEDELRKDIEVCALGGVGYQIEMAGWNPGQTVFDSHLNLSMTLEMYRKLHGWCKTAGVPLLVSLTNWNITLSKYGNKGRPFASIVPVAKQLAQCVHDCGGQDFVYVQPMAETGKDADAIAFEKWCGELFKGWKLVYNGGSRPSKPAYGWPHFAYHPNSTADGGKRGGITISDTGAIIKQLAADGTLNGPGDPAKIAAWFARCKASGAIGAGYYAFQREKHDAAAIRACAGLANAPEQPVMAGSWPSELSSVTWLHTNVRDWPATAIMTASVSGGSISFPYDKADVWPVATSGVEKGTNANVWAIVNVGGAWYAGTWEWLRKGQTSKPMWVLDKSTGKGDHFKVSPMNNWTPKSGDQFYLMVSGHARSTGRNVKERSNVFKVTWP